nr:tandem-95 repeat protein [Halodesulfovibrio sp. MK-HDV]
MPTADLTTNFDTGVEDQTLYITRADIISSLNIDDVEDGQNVILDLTTDNPNIQNISYDAVNEQYVIEPVENFNGDVQFNLSIIDQEGASIQRTIGANFDPVNDVPTADLTANFDTGVEDQTLYITRADIISSLNIADVEDGQNVILDLTTANPNIQNISYDAVSEQYVIEPVENFNGNVQFNLSITDQEGASIQRTIGANFDPVNDVPTADLTANFDTGVEDQTLYITRADIISSLNIADVEDGQNVILDLTTANPNIQNISYDAVSEQYVIEPVENFNGNVQFNLSITDQEGASIQRTIGANFDPVNDMPTADLTTNFDTGVEDQTLYITRAEIISSLNIDDVEDGQNVILDLTTSNPNIQNISYDAVNEQYVIEPVENFNGDVQFNLTITDQEGASIQRTIGANFDPVNDVPTAADALIGTIEEDATVPVTFTAASIISDMNIVDVDGDNLTLTYTPNPVQLGVVTYEGAGGLTVVLQSGNEIEVGTTYSFTPAPNTDTDFVFDVTATDPSGATVTETATIDVLPVNDAPTLTFEVPTNTNPNIIINGSFEDTDGVSIPEGGWQGFNVLPGWTKTQFDAEGNPIDPRDQMEVHDEAHGGLGSADAENYMDLGASPDGSGRIGNVGMTQVINDAIIDEGEPYQLTFFIKNKAAAFNSSDTDSGDLKVVWNGIEVPIDLPDGTGPDWVEVNVAVTAGAGDNVLTFYETGEGGDNHGMAVDNISLIEVATITAPIVIPEDLPTDTVIAHAVASDIDSENLTFSFADGSLEQNGFVINQNSGEIKVTAGGPFNNAGEPFDIDAPNTSDTITLDVKVDDNDGASTTQQLVISLTDINDNPVAFAPAQSGDGTPVPNYAFTVTEADTAVGAVTAVDIDRTAGDITYSLENTDGSPVNGFTIDQSGNIVITDPNVVDVDANNVSAQQTYVVRAQSEDGSVNTQQITVSVQDVNDNPVIFDPAQNNDGTIAPNYMFTMDETAGVVGTVSAQDADFTAGDITYSLENVDGSTLNGFAIDQNGNITVTDPSVVELDPDGLNELQSFVVRAQSEDGSQSTQSVQLTVQPVNEYALDFTDSTIQPVVIEETVNPEDGSRVVTQVEAKDFDYTENVTYELLNHTDKFEIDSQTGEITVKQGVILDNATSGGLDALGSAYESNGVFTLTEASMQENGAIWSNQPLDLTKDFSITSELYFGASPGGEGIAFVLHPGVVDPSTTSGGSELGANIDNAIVVEFDTNKDSSQGDPGFDHIAIHTDGNVTHESRPVQLPNIEDRDWHEATFTWDATNEVFTVTFEGRTATLSGDITQHLANSTEVNFGFTGSTANNGNLQQVNILSIDGIDQVYDLDVQATSADANVATPNEVITTTIPVTITSSPDVNVNDVQFDTPTNSDGTTAEDFNFTVTETNTVVGTINATDADYRSGDITYSLENSDGSPVSGFEIDQDGVITVTNPDVLDIDPNGENILQSFVVRAQADDGSESTQEVSLNVLDVNDNAVIFAPAEDNEGAPLSNYVFSITETDSVVGTVAATDNDYTAGEITYSLSYRDGSPADGFEIDGNGVITVTDPTVIDVDPDGGNSRQKLIVKAESEDGSISGRPITIAVQDVNDNAVIFDPAESGDGSQLPDYAFTITESDSVVGTVAASDNDLTASNITYSLENADGSPIVGYAIDQSGNITITNQNIVDVDPDGVNALQNIVVRAESEDGSVSTQPISITVQDINDNALIFDPAQNNDGSPAQNYMFTMNETVGVVGTITAQDADFTAGDITYSLENADGTPLEGFAIDQNGSITVTDPDAVDLDPNGLNELQSFVVRAQSEDGSENTQAVQLTVEPINEHVVDFTDSTIQPVVIEETVNPEDGSRVVTQVEAKDFDYTENVTYELLNHTDKFEIDSQTGEITVKEGVILDNEGGVATFGALGTAYESNGIYTLTDAAQSQDGAIWSDQTLNLTQDFSITTDIFLGSSNGADGITFVLHPDGFNPADTTHGGSLGANIDNAVVVEFDTYRNSDLGDPWQDHVSIHTDGDLRHGSDHSQAIQTSDLEDGLWHEATFAWDATAEVFTVTFEGQTATLTGGLSQHLANSTNVHFGFTGTTGGLYNLQQVNIKSVEGLDVTYDLDVQATSADADLSTPSEVIETTIPVTITSSPDVNVNDVVFETATNSDGSNAENFTFTITEANAVVGTITASDADFRSGEITFSLENPDGSPANGFAIDQRGVITVTDSTVVDIDPDGINALQNLVVRAEADDGSVTTQDVTISVQDINDNPVIFAPAENSDGSPAANYTFTISETDANVGTITAADNDFTAGNISYSLEDANGEPVQGFAIDQNGNITITDPSVVDMDPDGTNALQNMVVRATAEDGSVNTQQITISVQDVDDNPVIFAPAENSDGSPAANYTFTISETDANVGTITAADNDFTAGDITYSLEDASGNPVQGFAIDQSGNITITDQSVVDMDPDGTNALQNMVVRATAEDGSVNTQQITISVQDVDDNPVIFAPAENNDGSPAANYTFTITEADANVGTITAADNDFTAGDIAYSLEDASGNPVQGFAIDQSGNITITDQSVVDMDPNGTNALQNMVVRAVAEDGSVNTQQITISVQDVDDNPVIFAPAENNDGSPATNYTFTITEADANVGTITAADNDFTAGDIAYSLEDASGNPVQGFAIDQSGNITITDQSVVDMDPDGTNSLQNMIVRATAEDGSVNTQQITISVQDVNDNPIIFDPAQNNDGSAAANFMFTMNETDGTVGTITAQDADFTAGSITYSIEDANGNPVQGFAINQDGVITVTDPAVVDVDADDANANQNLVVRAQSEDGSESTQQVAISVLNVNDDIGDLSDIDASSNVVDESVPIGTYVGVTLNAVDVDGDAVTYSLPDDVPFTVGDDGRILTSNEIEFGDTRDFIFEATATSSDGSSSTQTITIEAGNLNPEAVGENWETYDTQDTSVTGILGANSAVDVYEFQHNGGRLILDALTEKGSDSNNSNRDDVYQDLDGSGTQQELDIWIEVWDDDGNRVAYNDDGGSRGRDDGSLHPYDSYLDINNLDPGNYEIRVSSYRAQTSGPYKITIQGDVEMGENPYTTFEDTQLVIDNTLLLGNDSDPNNDSISIVDVNATEDTHGEVSLDAEGNVVFTPELNFNGEASFTYTISDGRGGEDTATVTVFVEDINDVPQISVVETTLTEDTAQIIATASDVDGEIVSNSLSATHGTVSLDTDGNILYTPDANYNGADSVLISVTDDSGGISTQTININVTDVNDAVVVGDVDLGSVAEDGTIIFTDADLIASSSDVDGDDLTVTNVTLAADVGTLTDTGNGLYTFAPAENYNGENVPFDFTVSDGVTEGSATATLDVTAINDAPVVGNIDLGTTAEDTAITFTATDLLASSSDVEGNDLTVTNVSLSANVGTLTNNGGDSYTFTPAANFNGEDVPISFTVSDGTTTVTASANVDVTAINDAPVAENVDLGSIAEDGTITFTDADLIASSSDVDGDNLTVTEVSLSAEVGALTDNGGGSYTFTPTTNYNGENVPFSFTVSDGTTTASATATLDVSAVNDASIVGDIDLGATAEDTAVTFTADDLLASSSDVDGDNLTVTNVSVSEDVGTLTNVDGTYTFTPAENFNGEDVPLTFNVFDGTATVSATATLDVTAVNDASIVGDIDLGATAEDTAMTFTAADLLASSSDVDGDNLTVTNVSVSGDVGTLTNVDGTYTFTPTENFNGEDVPFTFSVFDGTATVSATANLDVTAVNDAPIVGDINLGATSEDTAMTFTAADLLASSSDVDGDNLTVTNVSVSEDVGTLTNVDGTYTFTPAENFNGEEVPFTFSVFDGTATVSATATLDVTAVNDASIVGDIDLGATAEDTAVTFTAADLLASSSDVDGDNLTVTNVSVSGDVGTLTSADGTYTFTPTENFNGEDVPFTFSVFDGTATVSATATLDVTAVNDASIVEDIDLGATAEDTAVTFTAADLLASSSDVDGDNLTVTNVSVSADVGTLTNDDGTYTFTPAENFNGEDIPFTFSVFDGTATVSATATLDVTAINDAPIVGDIDLGATTEDTAMTFTAANLIASSSDADGDNLIVTNVSLSEDVGTLTDNGGGNYTFTPADNFNGEDVPFSFIVSDGTTATSATATLDVTAINDDVGALTDTDAGSNVVSENVPAGTYVGITLNAVDVDGDTVTYSLPDDVPFTVGEDGRILTSGEIEFGDASDFTFEATATSADGSTSTQSVTITAGNLNPEAVGESWETYDTQDTSVTGILGANSAVDVYEFQHNGGQLILDALTEKGADYNNSNQDDVYQDLDGSGTQQELDIWVEVWDDDGNRIAYNDDGGSLGREDGSLHAYDSYLQINDLDPGNYEIRVSSYRAQTSGPYKLSITGDVEMGNNPYTTFEATPLVIDNTLLLGNDSDPNNDSISITEVTATADTHGEVALDAEGNVVFTPEVNFDGEASFTYTISDGQGGEDTATVTVFVENINNAPRISVVGTTLLEDTAQIIATVDDVNGEIVSNSLSATHGTVTLDAAGNILYTPDENYNGADSVSVSVTNENGEASTQTIDLNVTGVNDVVVVGDIDLGSIAEDGVLTFTDADLLASSTDADGDNLTITNVSLSEDVGTLTDNGGGSYTFTPTENYNGENVPFDFAVSDGTATASATANLDITAVNDAPVARDVDLGTMTEDGTIVISETQLLANANDVDGDTLSVVNLTSTNGAFVDNGNGTWNFTPTDNFSGSINVNYDVYDGTTSVSSSGILAVNAVADAPSLFIQVANTDAVFNDTADFSEASTGVSFDLTNHDAQTVNGDVDRWETNEATGSDFNDVFSFDNLEAGETYTVHGGIGNNTIDLSSFVGSNVSIDNDSGTLTVTIDDEGNTATINYDNISMIKFDSNVFDGTPHSVELDDHDWQINGTEIEVTSDGAGDWAVSPINFAGTLDESFTLNIVVTAHDDSPWHNGAIVFDYQDANNYKMAVARIGADRWQIEQVENGEHTRIARTEYIQLDTDVPNEISLNIDGGVATIFSNGVEQISHDFGTPLNNGQIGVATNNSHTSFELNMEPSNWAPSVENYDVRIQVQDGGFTTQNVLADAFDPEGASLEITDFSQAGHGTVVDNGDGTLSYVPAEGYIGVDTFTYEISDGDNTTVGTVSIDVQSDAAISITSGESIVLDVGASLADLDGSESLSVMLEGLPKGSVITDGVITLSVGENGIADVSSMSANELLLTSPESYNASFDVTVRAISTEDTGSSVETSSEFSVNILNADLPTTGSVEIQGTAEVGGLLIADISNLVDLDGDIIAEYQWYRGEGDSKEAIDGATGSDYTLTAADANHQITVEVNAGDLDGFSATFADSTTYIAANPEFQGLTQSRELLLNGDFEDGSAHWTNDFGVVELQQAGSLLWGESNNNEENDTIAELSADNITQNNLKQTVTVDSDSESVTLKFDYKARVDILSTQQFSVFLGTVLIAENVVSGNEWQTLEITVPVSDLGLNSAGELTVEFYEATNATVGVMLDDISLTENLQTTSSTIHIDNDIAQDGVLASLADFDENSTYTLTNPDGSTSDDFSVNESGQITPLVTGASLPSGLTELKLTIDDGEGNSSETNIFITKDTIDDIIYSSSDDMGGGPIILDGNSINDITGENDATDRFHIEGNDDVLIINFDATQGDTIDISSVLGGAEERIDLSASNIEEYVDISGDSGNFTITVKSEAPEAPEQVITIQDASGLDDQAALIQMLLQNN